VLFFFLKNVDTNASIVQTWSLHYFLFTTVCEPVFIYGSVAGGTCVSRVNSVLVDSPTGHI